MMSNNVKYPSSAKLTSQFPIAEGLVLEEARFRGGCGWPTLLQWGHRHKCPSSGDSAQLQPCKANRKEQREAETTNAT
jgi:hypothetical protein